MSIASIGYRQVQKIVSAWTDRYQFHISLLQSTEKSVKFMVEFSLTKQQKPIPIGTVRVYFTCKNVNDQLDLTFRFQKDSLIHSVSKTIRHKQLQKWIDDTLQKKLLVRQTVFYLGTSYEKTRVTDERQDKILQQKVVPKEQQFIFISPQLLSDQQHSIQVMQRPKDNLKIFHKQIEVYWRQVDKDNIGVVTHPQFVQIFKNMGINLSVQECTQVFKRVDEEETGTVQFFCFKDIALQIVQSLEAKRLAVSLLQQKKDEQIFGSILTLINDDTQDIQGQMIQHFRTKDQDETGFTNISQIKSYLELLNSKAKQAKKQQSLSPIQMAQISKILTDLYGYKQIPYEKVHKHIIDLKIANFTKGRLSSAMNNLQIYLRDIFDQFDQKKFGRIKMQSMLQAIKKSKKIILTKAQIYALQNIIPKDSKGEVNYIDLSKFIAQLIKKFYIHSGKRKE